MEDSNAMTVEFLRARLLSERAVSRSARQRADELAKRVEDLEEQLRIVSLERRRAEKTTADILAILEENGYAEISEAIDSSSEDESLTETKVDNDSTEVEESSLNAKLKEKEGGVSASEHDFSPVNGRSLSWKGRRVGTNSSGKDKQSTMRRRSSSESVYFSSPKHHHGKSCRQIRRRELRSVVESHITDKIQEHEVATSAEEFPRTVKERPCAVVKDSALQGENDMQKKPDLSWSENERNDDTSMEKALEQQAQLIGNYEALEKAQREWEEKFKDNNACMQDPLDPGNHSDVTEESEEFKVQAPGCGVPVVSFIQCAGFASQGACFVEESSKTRPNGILPPVQVNTEPSESGEPETSVLGSAVQDFARPGGTEKRNLEKEAYFQCHSSNHHSSQRGPNENRPALISTSNSDCRSSKVDASHSQNRLVAPKALSGCSTSRNEDQLVAPKASSGCSEVLEALKQAKLSLRQNMVALPPPSPKAGSAWQTVGSLSTVSKRSNLGSIAFSESESIRNINKVPVPVGCPGLFRVPMDIPAESSWFSTTGSGSRQPSRQPDTAITLASRDRLTEAPKVEFPSPGSHKSSACDSALASSDRLPTTPYISAQLSFPMEEEFLSSGARSSNRYAATPATAASLSLSTTSNQAANDWLVVTRQRSETGPRIYTHNMGFEPQPNAPPPSSTQQVNPAALSYQNRKPPVREGFPTFYRNPTFRGSNS